MTRPVTLGGRTFNVPPLPLRVTRAVYPLCQKLTNAGLVERLITAGQGFEISPEEMDDLSEAAFLACQAAEPDLTREAFEDLPVTPAELFDAFFEVRYATGGWRPIPKEGQETSGEETGAAPPTSTSTES